MVCTKAFLMNECISAVLKSSDEIDDVRNHFVDLHVV